MSIQIYPFHDTAQRKHIGVRFSGGMEEQDGLKQCGELKYCNQNKAWYLPYDQAVWQKWKANFPDLKVINGNALSRTEPAHAHCGPKLIHHTGIAGRLGGNPTTVKNHPSQSQQQTLRIVAFENRGWVMEVLRVNYCTTDQWLQKTIENSLKPKKCELKCV